jgi:large subunit ribosomal protein L40
MRLDPKRRTAYEDARAKAVAEATPFPEEVRETIVNAYLLHKRRARELEVELAHKRHGALVKALDDLERLDPVRFARATDRPACQAVRDVKEGDPDEEGRLPGLFPRQLRVPSYTPGPNIYDAEWRKPEPEQS